MILRELHAEITKVIGKGKAIIVYGPRQVGKTTLLKSLLENHKFLFLNGDDKTIVNALSEASTFNIKRIIGQSQNFSGVKFNVSTSLRFLSA